MKVAKYFISLIMLVMVIVSIIIINPAYVMGYSKGYTIKIEAYEEQNIDRIINCANDNQLVLFSTTRTITRNNKSVFKYFVSDKRYDDIKNENHIPPGKYISPFTDEIIVSYNDLAKLDLNKSDGIFYCYNASNDQINNFCKQLSSFGYVSTASDSPFYINLVYYSPFYLLVFSETILLIITYVEISNKKKEILIKFIHGNSYLKSVILSAAADSLFYLIISVCSALVITRYTKLCTIFFTCKYFIASFLFFNTLIILSALKSNCKEITNGHQYSPFVLNALKFLKTSASLITTCIITLSLIILPKTTEYDYAMKLLDDKSNMVFINFAEKNYITENEFKRSKDPYLLKKSAYKMRSLTEKMLHETDELLEPVYITDISEFIDKPYKTVYCNFRAESIIKKIIPEANNINLSINECVFIIPENIDENTEQKIFQDFAELFKTIEGFEAEKVQIIRYKTPQKTISLKYDHNFNTYISPCICITSDTYKSEKYNEETSNHHYLLGTPLYKEDDNLSEIFSKYKYTISYTYVSETFKSKIIFYKSMILLSELSITLLLFFQITLVTTLIKTEYTINGKEVSIKKILGYSIIKRNINLFRNILISFIIDIFMCLILITASHSNPLLLLIAFILSLADTIITCTLSLIHEKKNIVKILKGGAL